MNWSQVLNKKYFIFCFGVIGSLLLVAGIAQVQAAMDSAIKKMTLENWMENDLLVSQTADSGNWFLTKTLFRVVNKSSAFAPLRLVTYSTLLIDANYNMTATSQNQAENWSKNQIFSKLPGMNMLSGPTLSYLWSIWSSDLVLFCIYIVGSLDLVTRLPLKKCLKPLSVLSAVYLALFVIICAQITPVIPMFEFASSTFQSDLALAKLQPFASMSPDQMLLVVNYETIMSTLQQFLGMYQILLAGAVVRIICLFGVFFWLKNDEESLSGFKSKDFSYNSEPNAVYDIRPITIAPKPHIYGQPSGYQGHQDVKKSSQQAPGYYGHDHGETPAQQGYQSKSAGSSETTPVNLARKPQPNSYGYNQPNSYGYQPKSGSNSDLSNRAAESRHPEPETRRDRDSDATDTTQPAPFNYLRPTSASQNAFPLRPLSSQSKNEVSGLTESKSRSGSMKNPLFGGTASSVHNSSNQLQVNVSGSKNKLSGGSQNQLSLLQPGSSGSRTDVRRPY